MTAAPGRVIFLHGASSSGKTTLARAVQATIEAPFLHLSIDHLRDSGALPLPRFASGEFSWKAQRAAFFEGFHAAVAAFVLAGNDVILEHILDTPGWQGRLAQLLAPADVFFVALHCERDELERRERARGDRPAGSAVRDHDTIHEGVSYDLELQSRDGVAANAARLIAGWRQRTAPSAFARLHVRAT